MIVGANESPALAEFVEFFASYGWRCNVRDHPAKPGKLPTKIVEGWQGLLSAKVWILPLGEKGTPQRRFMCELRSLGDALAPAQLKAFRAHTVYADGAAASRYCGSMNAAMDRIAAAFLCEVSL